jgi:peptidylprolyl isomerase
MPRGGQTVTIEYSGWLESGHLFDSSRGAGRQPYAYPFNVGQVIPGIDQGLASMRVGGKRRLVLPPSLGYGAQGAPPVIPPNATIVFDVELISVSG